MKAVQQFNSLKCFGCSERGFESLPLSKTLKFISSRDFCMKSKLGFYVCVVAWVAP